MPDASDPEDEIFSGQALSEDGSLAAGRESRGRPGAARPETGPARTAEPRVPSRPAIAPSEPEPPKLEPVFETDLVPNASSNFPEGLPFHVSAVELAEPEPRPPADFAVPRPERRLRFSSPDIRWGRWLVGLGLLGLVAVGAFGLRLGKIELPSLFAPGWLERVLPRPGPTRPRSAEEQPGEKRVGTPAPPLLILSEPSGATVFIGGNAVGKTPWAGDNVWPQGPLQIEVRKPGWQTWHGATEGGAERTVQVTLRRR
jgi:eukaryotic-like serine/threonine-protein kinase